MTSKKWQVEERGGFPGWGRTDLAYLGIQIKKGGKKGGGEFVHSSELAIFFFLKQCHLF